MIVKCRSRRCGQTLFTISGLSGVVEVKCPRCRTIHTYRYASTEPAVAEVRCPNSFKGRKALGGWCGQLVMKISHDTTGTLGYDCPRCRGRKTLTLAPRVLAST